MLSRRKFIKSIALATGASILPLGGYGFAIGAEKPVSKRLVVVMLRGAVDGLSVVVPYGEAEYYAKRTSIALKKPNEDGGVLDLDGFFGLNPSLASLIPYWQNHSLAFVHASGYPSNMRSHFSGQDIIETASLNPKSSQGGWLNSLLASLPNNNSATRAINFGGKLPRIFMGKENVATVPVNLKQGGKAVFENEKAEVSFKNLYASNPEMAKLFNEAGEARSEISSAIEKEMMVADNNAPKPNGFVDRMNNLAAIIGKNKGVQLAFLDLGGWDTHINQGNEKGNLANNLQHLGNGLAKFAEKIGDEYKNTVVMVVSEFGRTVAENGNKGTDHGHGNVMWLMGGNIKGGKVYGRWPTLAKDKLFEGRDLEVTTDFRTVIGAIMSKHFGLEASKISSIVDDYKADGEIGSIFS